MLDEDMKLVVTPKPKHDESLAGYVMRLTERNGYETPSVILLLTGADTSALHNGQFVFGERWNLSPLARLTGRPVTDLSPLRYASAPSETSVYRYLVFGSPVQRYFINAKRPKVCPDCLSEDAYCRKVWELAPVTSCPHHRRLLLEICPGCGGRLSWVRSRVNACRCGYDWRDAPPAPLPDAQLGVVRRIHRLCGLPAGKDAPGAVGESNPLDELDLEHLLSSLSFIAAQREGVIDATGKFSVKGRRNTELHDLFTRAAAVFDAWPTNFEEFFDWRRARPSGSTSHTGLHKDFGILYHGLYFNLAPRCFDFMRRAFENYVGMRWSGGYAATIRRRKGVILKDRKYATKVEAINRLRIDASYIDRLIAAGKLDALVMERSKKRMYLIELASLEKLELEFRESLAAEEVAAVLNVGGRAVADLVRHGCLTPHRGPDIDGLPFWRFTRGAADELLKSLEARVPRESGRVLEDAVDFMTARRVLSQRRYGVGRFLRDILDGKIRPCRKGGGPGVRGLIFRMEDIETLRSGGRVV